MITNESSFGVIPLTQINDEWHVLIISHAKGHHWGFPKGHAEPNETPLQSAERELREETGLSVMSVLSETPLEEDYTFYRNTQQIHKVVHYFICTVGGELILQPEEIIEAQWVPIHHAQRFLTFKEARSLCQKTIEFLTTHNQQ